jgi:hypothetical protein
MVNASFAIPASEFAELKIDTNYDSSNLEQKTKLRHIERHKSCGVSKAILSDGCGGQPCHPHQTLEEDAAWEALKKSIVYFRGKPIGTVAAIDKSQGELNYDQVTFPFPVQPLLFQIHFSYEHPLLPVTSCLHALLNSIFWSMLVSEFRNGEH